MASRKLKVEGIAISEGISRNGIKYTGEELRKFSPTLKGKPILCDHTNTVESIVGKVTNTIFVDSGKYVRFEGWVTGDEVIEKIKDGRIENVSIGAMSKRMVKEDADSDVMTAEGLEGLELSLTPVPGIASASIMPQESFTEENVKQMITEYMNENKEEVKEELKVEEKKEEVKPVEETVSDSRLQTENNNQKGGEIMEQTENKSEAILSENLQLKSQVTETSNEVAKLREELRLNAINNYKEKAKAKNMETVDVSNMSIETIKALTAQVESVKIVESKPMAQTQDVVSSNKMSAVEEALKGYTVERSELGGYSICRN